MVATPPYSAINGNPDCTIKQRCGNCVRDVQAEVKLRHQAARRVSEQLPPGQRQCGDCGKQKPIDDFNLTKNHRFSFRCLTCDHAIQQKLYMQRKESGRLSRKRNKLPCIAGCGNLVGKPRTRCIVCYTKQRNSLGPKVVVPKLPYECIEGCGTKLGRPNERCYACKSTITRSISNKANKSVIANRIAKSLATGTALGVMFVEGEPLALTHQCPVCSKPMLINSRCYEDSTGRPITLGVRARIILKGELG